ncbi:MAG: signal peptidase I [Oscillospiraceae bacterium]|nr:signal peptidase I [Oscillospiraceae bacterium]
MNSKFDFTREAYDWVESALLAVACMLLIFTFAGRMVGIDGRSMENTLHHADRVVSSRIAYTPAYGDIVVVTMPGIRRDPLIKRVIAVGGQEIDIDFQLGIVYVDGEALDEPYTKEPTHNWFDMDFPQTVPQGHVFIMGDNRNNSLDSRSTQVGMIDERYILGRVFYRVMPYDQMGVPR